MDINTILEIIKTNPACYFIAGLALGYFLRGFVLHGSVSDFRGKRPSRYQPKKADVSVKRASATADANEPSFEWADSTVNAFTSRRLGSISLDQHGKEFQ
ncbi:hypothetical protein [Methyloglobulus sp.]|jgi:hypothetical protein|uniref:hypothetical protein n=1 Tax=Methyloglobulus sp. TaxID=2518622 RepID=UPI0032B85C12